MAAGILPHTEFGGHPDRVLPVCLDCHGPSQEKRGKIVMSGRPGALRATYHSEMPLDFQGRASVTGRMAPDDETRRKIFADLTALLEDAAGIAADGQAPGFSPDQSRRLARRVRRLIRRASARLDDLD